LRAYINNISGTNSLYEFIEKIKPALKSELKTYSKNVKDDVVKYKGKMYVATETIQGYNPEQSKLWKKLSDSLKYTSGTESHIDPQTGDVWFDTSSGISYTYFDDGNTVQWVELS